MAITNIVERNLGTAFNGDETPVFIIPVNILSLVAGQFRTSITKSVVKCSP